MNSRAFYLYALVILSTMDAAHAQFACNVTGEQIAIERDAQDLLAYTKGLFSIPEGLTHFGGHSLGPTYKGSVERVLEEYEVRNELILGGHFASTHPGAAGDAQKGRHWFDCDRNRKALSALSQMTGAGPNELAMGNSLTVNNALLLEAFYMPDFRSGRIKILTMEHSFASDQAVVTSVIRQKLELLKRNGLALDVPNNLEQMREQMIVVFKSDENGIYSVEALEALLREQGSQIAVAHLEGVPFATGQRFYSKKVNDLLKAHGVRVGWDLAHLVGNRAMQLHNDGVDYATWCGYKYLGASAGGVGGYFVHSDNKPYVDYFPLQGWKAMHSDKVFAKIHDYDSSILHDDIRATRLGNPPPIEMADAQAVLELYDDLTVAAVEAKSEALTSFLIAELSRNLGTTIKFVTPLEPQERGAMLVFQISTDTPAADIEHQLLEQGFAVDVRPPANIRITPHPLYVGFTDVYRFASVLAKAISTR